jgi:ankyrin repeat protein
MCVCVINLLLVQTGVSPLKLLLDATASKAAGATLECVRVLLACGADPNLRDIEGCTALHSAVRARRTDLVNLLLAHGANSLL